MIGSATSESIGTGEEAPWRMARLFDNTRFDPGHRRSAISHGPTTLRVVFLMASFFSLGCLSPGEVDWTPIAAKWSTEGSGTEHRAAIPFFDHRVKDDTTEWALHPLIRRVRDSDSLEVQILDPIINYRETETRSRFYMIPLIWYQSIEKPEGKDWDFVLFPLVALGSDASGGSSYALFPIYGHLDDFLTYREVDFFLFPLYYSLTKDVTEEGVSRSITPLVGWTSGGPKDGSFHIRPLFSYEVWRGKSTCYTVLWPFFHYQEYNLDTDHPATLYSFWPLFRYDTANNHTFWSILWPFFNFNRETPDRVNGLENIEGIEYVRYDFPWPIFKYLRDRDEKLLRLFPFYSHYETRDLSRTVVLIPFFWSRTERLRDGVRRDLQMVPLVHWATKEYNDGRGRDSYLQLWPLFHRSAWADGRRDFSVLSLLPFRGPGLIHDFEANWGVFWNLFRYQRDDRGSEDLSALFGLIRWHRDSVDRRFALGPLYASSYHLGEGSHHQILGGLFSWTGREAGFSFRFLGIDLF